MINDYENMYAGLVAEVFAAGVPRTVRGSDTISIFGKSLIVDGSEIQLTACRELYPLGVLGELAAFLRKPVHKQDFKDQGCNYWDMFARKDGSLRLDYGNLWLDFGGYNQLDALRTSLTDDPMGRRHIISGWNPPALSELSLPCCHLLYQWYVTNDNELDMMWYQRSVDVMVGLPSDVILACALNQLVANNVGLRPGRVIMVMGDCHIYTKHIEGAEEYLHYVDTEELEEHYATLDLVGGMQCEDFTNSMFTIKNYNPINKINFEVIL